MERIINQKIINWAKKLDKPLLITGSFFVGKTTLVKELLIPLFTDYLYINLEINNNFGNIDSVESLDNYLKNIVGNKERFLIVIDEIQNQKNILYLLNNINKYNIVCISSLIDNLKELLTVSVNNFEIIELYPLTFEEFLLNSPFSLYHEEIIKAYQKSSLLPNDTHQKLLDLFENYLKTGGYPQVVNNFFKNNIIEFDLYERLIKKYTENISFEDQVKIKEIIAGMTAQKKSINKAFSFKMISKNASYSKYAMVIDYLVNNRIINYVNQAIIDHSDIVIKDLTTFNLSYIDNQMYNSLTNDVSNLVNSAILNQLLINNQEVLFIIDSNEQLSYLVSNNKKYMLISVLNDKKVTLPIKKDSISKIVTISTENFSDQDGIINIPLYATFCLKGEKYE